MLQSVLYEQNTQQILHQNKVKTKGELHSSVKYFSKSPEIFSIFNVYFKSDRKGVKSVFTTHERKQVVIKCISLNCTKIFDFVCFLEEIPYNSTPFQLNNCNE